MEKQGFTVYYNGKNVSVTALPDNVFMFQVSYKPVYVRLVINSNGERTWCDQEMDKETMLAKEIGELIVKHPLYKQ